MVPRFMQKFQDIFSMLIVSLNIVSPNDFTTKFRNRESQNLW